MKLMRMPLSIACLVLCLLNAAAPQRFARADSPQRTNVDEDPAQYVNPFV
jgi:hypothetical protein